MNTNTTPTRAADAALSFSTTPRNHMNFTTHNAEQIDVNGTYLQGELAAKYSELLAVFGEPMDGSGYKVDAEWAIRYEDGEVATIYNWKNGKNYCGDDGLPVEQIEEWNIGGSSKAVVDRVQIALDLHRETQAEAEPKDKIEEAMGSAIEMMNTIKAQKGQMYADAVQVALLCRKQMEMTHMLLTIAIKSGAMPKEAARVIHDVSGVLSSKIIAKAAKHAGVRDKEEEAKEMMEWAERIEDAEQNGLKNLLKEMEGDDE